MASALHEKLESLSARLRAENEEKKKSHVRFEDQDELNKREIKLDLNFGSPARESRPDKLQLCNFGGEKFGIATPPRSGISTPPRSGIATPPRSGIATPPRSSIATQPSSGIATPPRSGRSKLNLPFGTGRCLQKENSHDIDEKLKEITERASALVINEKKYPLSIDDLEWLEEIGSGTCGVVNKMKHKDTDTVMAVKKMGRSPIVEEEKRILMDLDVIMKCNDCPYIVKSYGAFISQADVYICMELMGTCLEKLLKKTKTPIPEPILGKIIVSVVKALQYLKEKHGVMHRDVKPSNILLNECGHVKLCDFGISGRLVDSKAKTRSAGCAAYMAPERIDPPDPLNPDYDVRADVWSLGISMVELATGEFPYKDCVNEFDVLSRIMNEAPPVLPECSSFSDYFKSFVCYCLVKDYNYRPKFDKLLEHDFIKKYEIEPVDVASWYQEVFKDIS